LQLLKQVVQSNIAQCIFCKRLTGFVITGRSTAFVTTTCSYFLSWPFSARFRLRNRGIRRRSGHHPVGQELVPPRTLDPQCKGETTSSASTQ